MYKAELHGKLARGVEEAEDILTSNVFSFYLYSDRIHLWTLLDFVGVPVTLQDAENAEFSFWPTLPDNTEPDLVLQVGNYYVVIEAKLHAGYGEDTEDQEKHQLLREARSGRKEALKKGLIFILLTITDEPVAHEWVYGVLKGADRTSWRWTNWSGLARSLESRQPVGRMGRDLLDLLWRKGLRRFGGFTGTLDLLDGREGDYFFNVRTSNLGRFLGFADLIGPGLIAEPSKPLFTVADTTRRS